MARVVRRLSNSLVSINAWLEAKAHSAEKLREFKEAIFYWSALLDRMTFCSKQSPVDVSELAAIHYRLGLAHRAIRDDSKSLYHLKYSVRLNSEEARYYEAFGKAYLKGGHWNVAKTQFARAVELDPLNPTYLRQYAWVLLMMGRKEEAKVFAKRAHRLAPLDHESVWSLVRVYMECENYLHARELLNPLSYQSERARLLLAECEEKFQFTFEGAVIHLLRKGMPCNGDPFNLEDLRRAEEMWRNYCLGSRFERNRKNLIPDPNHWAAAVAFLANYDRISHQEITVDQLLESFDSNSLEFWPCVKKLEMALPKRWRTAQI